jgi:hypothetical protein
MNDDMDARKKKIGEQEKTITTINREKEIMRKEIKDRERTVNDKDNKILELKKKN